MPDMPQLLTAQEEVTDDVLALAEADLASPSESDEDFEDWADAIIPNAVIEQSEEIDQKLEREMVALMRGYVIQQ